MKMVLVGKMGNNGFQLRGMVWGGGDLVADSTGMDTL